jgi:hypothetical protein
MLSDDTQGQGEHSPAPPPPMTTGPRTGTAMPPSPLSTTIFECPQVCVAGQSVSWQHTVLPAEQPIAHVSVPSTSRQHTFPLSHVVPEHFTALVLASQLDGGGFTVPPAQYPGSFGKGAAGGDMHVAVGSALMQSMPLQHHGAEPQLAGGMHADNVPASFGRQHTSPIAQPATGQCRPSLLHVGLSCCPPSGPPSLLPSVPASPPSVGGGAGGGGGGGGGFPRVPPSAGFAGSSNLSPVAVTLES